MMIPALTTPQMIEVDRLMMEDYGIHLLQMMENAGRNLAELCRQMLGGTVSDQRIAVLCGGGNNGGGGMVAARHLHNWGAEVLLKVVANPAQIREIPTHQRRILEKMGIPNQDVPILEETALIVDALIGYGLRGNPGGPVAAWIERMNAAQRPILALDTPSGLNTTTGIPGIPCIRATATLTLALPKVGLLAPEAHPFVGALYLADISVPPALYRQLGLEVPPLFVQNTLHKITP
jgi:NAD(P)H-hydrate epimerase